MNGLACAFEGRLGQDSEFRVLASGNAMYTFSVAVETVPAREGKPAVSEWIKCAAFGDLAASISEQHPLGRGDQVYVEGKLSVNRWAGQDGRQHEQLNVLLSVVQPLGKIGRRAPTRSRDMVSRAGFAPQHQPVPAAAPAAAGGDAGDDDATGLPW